MCLEDIHLGRALNSETRTVNLPIGVATRIAAADPKRVRMLISAAGFTCNYAPSQIGITINLGIRVATTAPPLMLRVEDIGNAITQEWFGIANGGNADPVIITSTLEKSDEAHIKG